MNNVIGLVPVMGSAFSLLGSAMAFKTAYMWDRVDAVPEASAVFAPEAQVRALSCYIPMLQKTPCFPAGRGSKRRNVSRLLANPKVGGPWLFSAGAFCVLDVPHHV